MTLPTPTPALLHRVASIPASDPKTAALTLLFSQYPANTDIAQVLTKVATLNALFSTNILGVVDVAKHIVASNIDPLLSASDRTAVSSIRRIAIGGKARGTYSFATKYCSWHKPECYPIYDRYVAKALHVYAHQDAFTRIARNDLEDYERFAAAVHQFKTHYALSTFSLREVDHFLWQQGKQII